MKIRLLFNILFSLFVSSAVFAQAPVNDDPCNATPLTASTGCNYVTGTNLNATATAGVPAPGCANYVGGDVWFSVTVPASGSLIFDSNTGVVTDGGMAIYSGTCSNLTLISCNDDGSANGLMPSISANGLTPGSTIYIRFWEYGNDNNGDFSICVEQITPCATVSTNSSCVSADPFCTGTSYNYCNTVNVPSLGGGGIYGCCGSTPNPAFYFMNIQTSGSVVFNISQTSNAGLGIDVDFVLWGPFASQAAMCAGLAAGNIIDCSFSIAAVETATISNAIAGQWYMILITNYSNQPGNIQFNQTNTGNANAGSTNCNILTAIPSPCSNGLYTLAGSVEVPAPPTTGTLTVSSSCGGSVVFNAPFVTPISYSIPNICATGDTCTATAVFSAAGAPTILPTSFLASSCNSLTAVPSVCTGNGYSVSGIMTAYCLPVTGTLTFTSSCGGSVTYNAPFSSPFSYTIPNMCANGGNCTITAAFSAANAPVIPNASYSAPVCNSLTATPGICTGGQYIMSGVLINNGCIPATGTLTIASSCGGSVVYNAPFTSPLNWSLPASNGNGGNCTITAVYSAAGAPLITSVVVAEPQCCNANAGTIDVTVNGGTITSTGNATQVVLCSGGSVSLISNDDYILPPAFDPGWDDSELFYAIYVSPGPTVPDPDLDPNWTGYYWTGEDFFNNAYATSTGGCSPLLSLPAVPGYASPSSPTNTLVFVPITADDSDNGLDWDGVVAHDQNGDGCFDIGDPISITFLNPIELSSSVSCAGTVSIQINGGNPQFFNNSYTISNTGAGTLSSTTATAGGVVSISGLTSGQTYSVSVTDATGCTPTIISGVYQGPPTVNLTANPATICLGECSSLNATVSSGLSPGNKTIKSTECAIIKDAGISAVNGSPIVNTGNWAHTCIDVTGVCDDVWNTGEFLSVQLNIQHSWVTDLDIYLQAPNGVFYLLSQDNGGGNSNYTNTIFTATAATSINAGTAPFTGSFRPQGAGGNFNALNGTTINGSWCLWVGDDGAIDQGSIVNWSITFANQNSYTYSWSPTIGLSSTTVLNPLACPTVSTSYTLTVTNSCGCTTTASVPVIISPPITPTFNTIGPICSGALVPSLPTTSTNGIIGTWSPNTINNTASASYTFSPSAGQCADTITISVVIDNAPTLSSIITKPLCLGNTNGAIDLTVNGGTGPFAYQWSNGSTNQDLSSLAVGTYTVTVSSANGCTAVLSNVVAAPLAVVASIASTSNINCFGQSTGGVTASGSGGTSPYTYLWSTGATTNVISNLPAGVYTITVTDANGCTNNTNVSATLLQQPQLTVNIPIVTNVSCFGGNNGSITASPTGGTAGYTYSWSNGATGPTTSGLTIGSYTVTVTDSRGCTNTASTTIAQPPQLVISIPSTTNVLCNGGATGIATALATSGTPVYTYLWSNGGSTATVNNLTAGTYVVTATDANGCTISTSATITQPPLLTATIPITTNVLCNGGSTGSATVSTNGGTTGYTYLWNTGSISSSISNLTAGTYTVTAMDVNGCTSSASTNISQPTLLVVSIPSTTNILCNGGATGIAIANASNGTPIYSYAWSTGATTSTISNLQVGTYTVTVTDANGCTNSTSTTLSQPAAIALTPSSTTSTCGQANGSAGVSVSGGVSSYSYLWSSGQTTAAINNVASGGYVVTVTDANGCTSSTTANVGSIGGPTVTLTNSSNVSCFGGTNGSAQVNVSSGTGPFIYNWLPFGGGSNTASNLSAGSYSVNVTDGNGCTSSVSVVISQPAQLALSIPTTSNVLCNGGSTGSATALASNGTIGYSYLWNNGSTSATNNNLTAGTYTVTATDGNGCTISTTASIAQPSALTIAIPSTTNVLCNGGATGSATALASNGSVGYTYQWNTGATTSTINNLLAGTYTVTATDANGCTTSTAALVTQPSALTLSIPSTTNVLCNGGATGSATAIAANGSPVYTYLWSNGGSTATLNNLTAGVYAITATDANGCTTSTTASITQPSALTIAIPSTTNVLCNGGATGSATAMAANGSPVYTYLWSNGGNAATANNLTAGAYVVTATDANGCTTSTTATITQPSQLTLSILSTTNVLCNGAANGSITSLATNGTIGYNYNWSTGATSATVSNLTAGTYTVTATDGNGCTASTTAIVSQPTALAISIPSTTNVLCNGGATGNVTALASNGSVGYTYQWNTGATTSTINNLIAGVYTVTATDANGCTTSTTALVTQPSALTLSIPSTTNVLCNGGATGSATALAANGTPVYTYLWSNGGSTATVNSLTAGVYAITATDANGCTTSTTATISQPIPLTLSIPSTSNVLCNGGATGSASVSASGGAGSYTYLWSTGSTTSSVSNLAAGTYTVTATDANGCTTSTTAIITQPSLLTLSIPSTTNVLCNGESTGSATALAASGSPGYTYQWNTGATTSALNSLTVGIYTVTATDANGCTSAVSVTITQPSAIVLSTGNNPTLCGQANGSANVSAVGGNPAYTYSWSSGQTTSSISNIVSGGYVVTVTDGNGCTISTSVNVGSIGGPTVAITTSSDVSCFGGSNGSAQVNVSLGTGPFNYSWLPSGGTGVTASNLSAGSYTVNVTDNNGCTSSASVLISEPSLLTVSIPVTTNVLCNGGATGSATALASNGTAGYTYQWNTGSTSAIINNLIAGIYTVTTTDGNGCTTSATASIAQPSALVLAISSTTNVLCNGGSAGSATALASNGTAGYTYQWNTGATTSVINNLTAGTYTVTATDANGCTTSTSTIITQPSALSLAIPAMTNVLCNGGNTGGATALASNGTAGYTYQWNTGATTSVINNLTAGIYTVTATDANGCTTSATATISQPTLLTLSIPSTSNVLCNGGNTGSATALASDGTAGYTYSWSNGSTNAINNNLTAGTYTVTATDANGCTISTTTNIIQPSALTLSIPAITNVICNGGATGSVTALASNGSAGYTYIWSNGSTTAINNNLTAGTYTITATDANGCTTSTTANIAQPSALALAISSTTNVLCNGGNTGSAIALASNGTAGYSYLWSNGSTNAINNTLTVGTYTVTATDANGCTTSTTASIIQPSALSIAIPAVTNVLCNGGNTGSATALASNGTSGYTYQWNTGVTTAAVNNLTAGIYTVTATDVNGCSISTTTNITQPSVLTVSIPTTTNVLCNGGTTGSATALAANGTSGYTYQWNTGVTTAINNNLAAGTYTVTATDANGCTTSTTATISQPTLLTISIPSTTNVLCNGNATGSVTALAANGTSGYTYQWNTGATTPTMNNLTAGTYTVTATDANGCTVSLSALISQPTAISLSSNSSSTLCGQLNGSASVVAIGGSGAYSYLWSGGQTTPSINNVASGGYVITVTDANGCTISTSVNIGSIGGPTVAIANSSNVSCFGGTNGDAQVNVSAGQGPFTYSWLPSGGNGLSATNLSAGNYTINVTDINGCTSSATVVISQPTQLSISIPSFSNVLCNGGSTGSATALATNGTSGYSYLWSNGSTTLTINNLSAGTYTVTVTDGNGCSASSSAIITQPSLLTVAIPSATNVLCNGAASGSITALASNGTSGYSYLWSNGGNNSVVNNLTAGVYVVTATDVNGCTASASATITQPSIINIQTNSAASTCGLLNGSAGVNVSGGTSGYTFQWSNGQTSSTINNLATGFYTVTVTDANTCTASVIINVGNIGGPSVAIASYSNVGCFGDATGTAQVNISSGTAPYTYNWLPTGGSASSTSNLTAGNYSVVVTDANGCTTSTSLIITEPSALGIQTSTISSACGQLNGGASVIVSGGVAGYNYQWSNGQTTSAINNVAAGGYTVTVIDGNGCTSTTAVNIGTIGGPTVAIANSANVTCFGGSNGSAQVNVSAGVAPFTYAWTPSGGSNLAATNLTAGNYTVSVTDANGCSNSVSVNITESASINLSTSSVSSSCGQLNGSATVSANGGSGALSYLWNGGQTTNSVNNIASGSYSVTVTDANGCTNSTTVNIGNIGGPTVAISNSTNVNCFGGTNGSAQANVSSGSAPFTYAWLPLGGNSATANNLTAGNYSVNVTDANGCTSSASIVISEPSVLNLSANSISAACGQSNGSATLNVTGGGSSYSYLWSGGQTTSSISNVLSGPYSVTVTDANGCSSLTSVNVGSIGGPSVAIASSTNVSCFGGSNGSAQVNVNAGVSPYVYLWVPSGGNSALANNLAAGNYTVNVTDANGCTTSVSVVIGQPSQVSVTIPSTTNVLCNGAATGSATALASNGTSGYTYQWNTGATSATINNLTAGIYTVTATDGNGCTISTTASIIQPTPLVVSIPSTTNVLCYGGATGTVTALASNGTSGYLYQWNTGATGATINNLTAGTYTVTVTDANGCTITTNAIISQPTQLTVSIPSTTNVLCNGNATGSATALATNGTSGYTYQWNTGATNATINNLTVGTYTVTATDANGCTTSTTAFISQPTQLTVSILSTTNVLCNGGPSGSATASASNGTSGYNYLWSNGTTSSIAFGLIAGIYTVTATDANGCTTTTTASISQPTLLTVSIPSTTNVLCNGNATGSATALATNGTAGYSYQWNNGAITATINNLTAGIYTVTATDANGCTSTINANITQPSALALTIPSTTNILCYGGTNGTATALASNGTAGYNYLWSNGSTSSTNNNLTAGVYTVTATDANGCSTFTSTTITQPNQLIAAIPNTTNVLCYSGATGTATATASSGTANYSYLWSNGTTTALNSNLTSGNYTVTITDANGCTATATTLINTPTVLSLSNFNSQDVSCNGLSDGVASLSATGGTIPYVYSWNPSVSSSGFAGSLTVGNYSVVVTDANGCSSNHAFTITQPSAIVSNATITDASCHGSTNGSIAMNVNGGIFPYTYNWSNGSTLSSSTGLATGNYAVTVTDAHGCTNLTTWSVNEPAALSSNVTNNDASCYGLSDGSIQVNMNGGTPSYQIVWTPSNTGFNLSNLQAGTYIAVITDANGCTHALSKSIAQPSQIVVNASTPTTLCIGQSQTLSLIASGGSPGYTYLWSNQQTTPSINVSPAVTTNYSVVVTDVNGCTTSLNNLLVNVHPPLQLNIAANNDTICLGQSVSLSANASGGNGGPYTYNWNNGINTTSQMITPSTTGVYSVSVSDGCTTPNAQQSLTVVVNPIPTPAFTPGNIQGCSPVSATFNLSSASGSGNTYLWSFGDNTTSTSANPTHQYSGAGSYNVTLTVTNQYGCTGSVTNNNVVNVFALPIAKFTPDPSETQLLTANINFNNYSVGAAYYNWNFGDNATSTDFSPSHIYGDTGLYEVRLIASSLQQCRDTAYEYVHVVGSFTFWCPNAFSPNDDLKNDGFTGYGVGIKSATFVIFNRWGEKIYTSDNLANPWDGTFWNKGDKCPEDVYVYLFDVVSEDNEHHKYTGRVSLIK